MHRIIHYELREKGTPTSIEVVDIDTIAPPS